MQLCILSIININGAGDIYILVSCLLMFVMNDEYVSCSILATNSINLLGLKLCRKLIANLSGLYAGYWFITGHTVFKLIGPLSIIHRKWSHLETRTS